MWTGRERCESTTRAGTPCQSVALGDSGRCFAHSPDMAEKRRAAMAKGGRNSSRAHRLRALVPPRLTPLYDVLDAAIREVHDGVITPPVATAIASLARALVYVTQAGELEERVRKLEEQAQQDGAAWPA